MTDRSLAQHTLQLAAIWQDLVRIRPHVKTMLPENLARAKERLREINAESGPKRGPDYALFYRVGIAFAQKKEALTMGELRDALDVPLSTATRIVDWLVESGYAERSQDSQDRRVIRVALTKSGKELFRAMDAFMQKQLTKVLEQFTAQERENLIALLRKMVRVLEGSS
jgi:DNA-binding MarR family transcriptional regulator